MWETRTPQPGQWVLWALPRCPLHGQCTHSPSCRRGTGSCCAPHREPHSALGPACQAMPRPRGWPRPTTGRRAMAEACPPFPRRGTVPSQLESSAQDRRKLPGFPLRPALPRSLPCRCVSRDPSPARTLRATPSPPSETSAFPRTPPQTAQTVVAPASPSTKTQAQMLRNNKMSPPGIVLLSLPSPHL